MTRLVHTRADLADLPSAAGPVGVVMTMGALHAGHVALVHRARDLVGLSGRVIVTVFVNPLQFGAGEDFERYPRTLDDDVAACRAAGADIVFAPSVDEVYRSRHGVAVDPGPLGDVLEGAVRPGHFRGVLTVVAKLLGLTRPQVALFGEKDYQQLTLIRAMVADLDLPVEVVGVPTVREGDGLALSSRNRYLGEQGRARAVAVPESLAAGVDAAAAGADAVEAAARQRLAAAGLTPDYVAVTDPELGPAPADGPARLLVAVPVDGTRLIDNVALTLGAAR